ncbi:MAG: DUF6498-containing protein, partial [Patescibacteria group bacterium]
MSPETVVILTVIIVAVIFLALAGYFVYSFAYQLWRTGRLAFSFFRAFPPTITIVGANIIPLAGVIWFSWSPFEALFTYWVQTVIIYRFALAKLKRVTEFSPPERSLRVMAFDVRKARKAVPVEKLIRDFKSVSKFGMISTIVFLIFMAGYISKGSFGIDLIFHSAKEFLISIQESWGAILIGSTAFLAHHSYSYSFNFIGKKEFLQADLAQQLRIPITRIGTIWAAVFMFASFLIQGFVAGGKNPLISLT